MGLVGGRKDTGRQAPRLTKNYLGGLGGPWSPFSKPPPPPWEVGSKGWLSFVHVYRAHFKYPNHPPPSKRPPCNKNKTPKASIFTKEPHIITMFRHVRAFPATGSGGGGIVPCEHALPPLHEIVGGKN